MPNDMKSVTSPMIRGHFHEIRKVVKPPPPPLDCQPNCPICGGIGWIRRDLPISDPNFGKLEPCPNLDLYRQYGQMLGLTDQEIALSWETDLTIHDKETRAAQLAVMNTLHRGYGWVYLWGAYGRAKSLILKIAISETIRSKKIGAYIRMASFIDHLRSAFDENNPNTVLQSRLDWWTTLPVLAIDELEKVSLTGFAKEKMFLLFDQRYEDATLNRKGITLMASNLPPAALDPYLTDRIRDGRFNVVELTGASNRPMLSYGNDE